MNNIYKSDYIPFIIIISTMIINKIRLHTILTKKKHIINKQIIGINLDRRQNEFKIKI